MAKVEVNWEKLADALADQIVPTDEFKKFCSEFCSELEDKIREEVRERFIDPLEDRFKPGEGEDIMEFVLTLEGDLITEFWKKFVTDFLGRKW